MDKQLIGLSGEYHVLAQLAHRGLVGALTLGHTKGVDILVTNPQSGTVRKVEVKATQGKPARAKVFGEGRFYKWPMSAKHESVAQDDVVYCFVALSEPDVRPRFFLVPSRDVAQYVKWEHKHWLASRPKRIKDNPHRTFRIEENDPHGYEDNWAAFD